MPLVLKSLRDAGVLLKSNRCRFLKTSIPCFGHNSIMEKVTSIRKAATPKNVLDLRSYLARVNYYRQYLNSISTILPPTPHLCKLLHKGLTRKLWQAEKVAEKQWKSFKLVNALVHYSPKLKLPMMVDTSSVGIGAVLSHMPDGNEKLIEFASRKVSKTEIIHW